MLALLTSLRSKWGSTESHPTVAWVTARRAASSLDTPHARASCSTTASVEGLSKTLLPLPFIAETLSPLLVIRNPGVRDLQKFFHTFAALFHDVGTNRGDVLTPLLDMIEWRIREETAFETVARSATENEVSQVSSKAAFRSGHKMVLCRHHEPVVVSLEVESAINTSPLIALEQLQKF